MKTEHITLALTIAHERSVSKAASLLSLSQPTASNMLKALEHELSFPVFERARDGMALTLQGAKFIRYAYSIENAMQAIAQIGQPQARLNFTVFSMRMRFPELAFESLCEKFSCRDCTASLQYRLIGSTEEATELMERGAGDLAVAMCAQDRTELLRREAEKRNLGWVSFGTLPLELSCRKGHPLLGGGSIAYELLGSYPGFTSVPREYAERYIPHAFLKGIESVPETVSVDSDAVRYRLLRKMDGFLVSVPLPADIRAAYELESLVIEDSALTIFAVYQQNPQKQELIREFIRNCQAHF